DLRAAREAARHLARALRARAVHRDLRAGADAPRRGKAKRRAHHRAPRGERADADAHRHRRHRQPREGRRRPGGAERESPPRPRRDTRTPTLMRVMKLGGRAQNEPRLAPAIAAAWNAAPGSLCVVHGGGDGISELQRALGLEPAFAGGRRVTSEGDIAAVRMALSGSANKFLVARLISAGVSAIGISGEDAALITARAVDQATLGCVGAPEHVDARL